MLKWSSVKNNRGFPSAGTVGEYRTEDHAVNN